MKNIFKRRKKSLIIAPTELYYIPVSCNSIIQIENNTAVIADPKTVSAIKRTLEHRTGTSKSIKVIGATENFADICKNNGYEIEFKEG